jgi:diguanylate cyclase (GGDEF)-like protein/PAS domain S-box-containing protein
MAPDMNKTRLQHLAGSTAVQEQLAASNQHAVTEGDKDHNHPGGPAPDKEAELQWAQQEIELNQRRFETLRRLTQMIHEPEQNILDFALEASLQATGSSIGYIYFVNEDETEMALHAWSKSVMAQCRVDTYPEAYKIEDTGLWGEAIRRRRPIITNDYPSNPLRRELPEGHVPLQRHMNLPLFDDGRIVLLAGVGNKDLAYNEQDVQQLSLVMEGMWNIIKRKRAEKALHQANLALEARVQERTQALQQANKDLEHYKGIVSSTPDLVALVDREYIYCTVNDSYLRSFGTDRQDIIGKKVADLLGNEDFERFLKPHLIQAFKGETVRNERWITFPVTGRRLCAITFHPVHEKEGHISYVAANIRDVTEARLAMDDRQRIFEASFDLMCVIGFNGCIKDLNRSWTRILGWSIEELQDKPWLDLVHPEDRTNAIETEERLLLGQQTSSSENRLRCKDGRYRWVSWNSSADRERQEIFAIARDITDSKLLQEALKSSVRKYRTFFDSAGDAVFVHDYSGRLLDVNRVACERLGYNREELLRMSADQLKATQTAVRSAKLLKKIDEKGQASFEARHRSKNENELLVWTNSRRIEYDGLPAILSICRDISERKRMENKLRNLSITDPLTGAKNRRYLANRGKEELARSLRYGTHLCLLLLDIDHFKLVNDTYGHDAGDEVLKSLTQKAQTVLRETDIFARFGGEEFAALLIQTSQQDALLTANRLRSAIETMPLPQINDTFSITISIGVALFDANDGSIEELIKRADQAMYQAKENGRNCVVLS